MDHNDVLEEVEATVDDLSEELAGEDDPNTVQDAISETTDTLFGQLVKMQRVDNYTVEDMTETIDDVAAILDAAERYAWLPGDSALWDGCAPYGLPAAVAFFALENIIITRMRDRGFDV